MYVSQSLFPTLNELIHARASTVHGPALQVDTIAIQCGIDNDPVEWATALHDATRRLLTATIAAAAVKA